MTTAVEALQARDINPRIGSEVRADKATLLSGEYAGEIRELLEQRGVLVFPQLGFTDEEQIAFTETLGTFAPEARGEKLYKVSWTPRSTSRPTISRGRCTGIWTAP
jgi:alpha-ketoglutarate-dependent taurine dioxygenase